MLKTPEVARTADETSAASTEVTVETSGGALRGSLTVPPMARGLVIFAHGSGSSRLSVRNQQVAASLVEREFATLLFDLLTADEEVIDATHGHLRFNIPLLAQRLVEVTDWAHRQSATSQLAVGYFGASTGAAAALVAAAERPTIVHAVVSRGGRPDLAMSALRAVRAPTLLLVGSLDTDVIVLNRQALAQLGCEARLELVPNATHLFPEPGALEIVARQAGDWFTQHLH
jgi:putative phosphoribosyl transferase